jgi:FAD synthetase
MPSSSCVDSHFGPPLLREFRNVSANCSAFFLTCRSSSTQVESRGLSSCGSIKGSGKRKIVLASGVFDLLHLGHVRFLEEAKKAGGPNAELVVIVARDETVKRRKKEKPVMPENQRCALVASLKVVDEALLGFERFDVGKVVEKISPDVIAFGYDQAGMEKTVRDYIKKHGFNIKVMRVGKFSEDELDSSSKIKQKIVEDFRR